MALLEVALRHPSARFESDPAGEDNQRLEFLGDAVLGLIATVHVYDAFPDLDEGRLTVLRSHLTSGKALAVIAASIQLGAHLDLGKGEELTGGRLRESILVATLEALFGAVYLDGGISAAQRVFKRLFKTACRTLSIDKWASNPKGQLQDISQRLWKHTPRYRLLSRKGPAHAGIFTAEVALPNRMRGVGTGRTRKEAEAAAAADALNLLRQTGRKTGSV